MNDFMELVMEMRQAQKFYFRNRSNEALINAKSLEKQVDEYLNKAQKEGEQWLRNGM